MDISIIIPVFNGSEYLEGLYASLQKLDSNNYEFIFVDDFSNDDSFNKLLSFREKDPRISVFKNEKNQGPSFTRNFGLMKAKYEYVMFLDVDDYLIPETLAYVSELREIFKKFDILVFGYKVNYMDTDYVKSYNPYIKGNATMEALNNFIVKWQFHPLVGSPSNKIYKRVFLLSNNLRFPTLWKLWEDYMFNLSIFAIHPKVYFLKLPIFVYNLNDKNPKSLHNAICDNIAFREKQTIDLYNMYLSCLTTYMLDEKYGICFTLILSLIRAYNINMSATETSKRIRDFINSNSLSYVFDKHIENQLDNKKQKMFFDLLKHEHYLTTVLIDKCILSIKKLFRKGC